MADTGTTRDCDGICVTDERDKAFMATVALFKRELHHKRSWCE